MEQRLRSRLFPRVDNAIGWNGPASYYLRSLAFRKIVGNPVQGPFTDIQIANSMVVSAAAYRKFMQKNQLDDTVDYLLKKVDGKDVEALQHPAALIKKIMQKAPLPECIDQAIQAACQRLDGGTIIVWPISIPLEVLQCSREYQQCPCLGVTGSHETIEAIKWWWASLFDAPVILYREVHGKSHSEATITVVAQQLLTTTNQHN